MKRGLKQPLGTPPGVVVPVRTQAPMKRGLKLFYAKMIAVLVGSEPRPR